MKFSKKVGLIIAGGSLFLSALSGIFLSAQNDAVITKAAAGKFDLCNGIVLDAAPKENPTWKSDYVFDGWYTKEILGDKVTRFNPTKTYYAHWKKKGTNHFVFTDTLTVTEHGLLYGDLIPGEELTNELDSAYGISFRSESYMDIPSYFYLYDASIDTENTAVKILTDVRISGGSYLLSSRAFSSGGDINQITLDATGFDLEISGDCAVATDDCENIAHNVNSSAIVCENLNLTYGADLLLTSEYVSTSDESYSVTKNALVANGDIYGDGNIEINYCDVGVAANKEKIAIKVGGELDLAQDSVVKVRQTDTKLDFVLKGSLANNGESVKISGAANNTAAQDITPLEENSLVTISYVRPFSLIAGNGEIYHKNIGVPTWDDHVFLGWFDRPYGGKLVSLDGVTFMEKDGFTHFELGENYYGRWQKSSSDTMLIATTSIVANKDGVFADGFKIDNEVLADYGINIVVNDTNAFDATLDGAYFYTPGTCLTLEYKEFSNENVNNIIIANDPVLHAYAMEGGNSVIRGIALDRNSTITGTGDLTIKATGTSESTNSSNAESKGIDLSGSSIDIDITGDLNIETGYCCENNGSRNARVKGIDCYKLRIINGDIHVLSGWAYKGPRGYNTDTNAIDVDSLSIDNGSLDVQFKEGAPEEERNIRLGVDYSYIDVLTFDFGSIVLDKFDFINGVPYFKLGDKQKVTIKTGYCFDLCNGELCINEVPQADPTWGDHIFLGWYDKKIGGSKVTTGFEEGKRYYARWQISETNTNLVFSDTLIINEDGLLYGDLEAGEEVNSIDGYSISYSEGTLTLDNAFICGENGALVVDTSLESVNVSVKNNVEISSYCKFDNIDNYCCVSSNVKLNFVDGSSNSTLTVKANDYTPNPYYKSTYIGVKAPEISVDGLKFNVQLGDITSGYNSALMAGICTSSLSVDGDSKLNIVLGKGNSSSVQCYGIYDETGASVILTSGCELSILKGEHKSNNPYIKGTLNFDNSQSFLVNSVKQEDGLYAADSSKALEVTNKPSILPVHVNDAEIVYGTEFEGNYFEIILYGEDGLNLTAELVEPVDGLSVSIETVDNKKYIKVVAADDVNAGYYSVIVTNGKNKITQASEYIEAVCDIEVCKAPYKIIKEPTAVQNLFYTGEPLTLVEEGEIEGGTLQYAIGYLEPFSDNVPTGTNAGYYSIYWSVIGDENHLSTEDIVDLYWNYLLVTVEKSYVIFNHPTAVTGLQYDGTMKSLINPGSTDVGEVFYALNFDPNQSWNANWVNDPSLIKAKNPGTYTIGYYCFVDYDNVNYKSNDNYYNYFTLEVTIDGIEVEENPFSLIGTYTYDGEAHEPFLSSTNDYDYEIVFKTGVDHTNVGNDIPFTVKLASPYSGEFDMTFNIAPKAITENPFTIPTMPDYKGSDIVPELHSTLTGATYSISFETGVDHKNVGNNIPFKVELTGNYSGSFDMTFNIVPKAITENPFSVSGSYAYTGEALTPVVNCSIADALYDITFEAGVNHTDARNNIPFKVTLKGNYSGSFDMTFNIAPKAITENPFTLTGTYTYNGSALTPTVNCSIDGASYDVTFADGTNHTDARNNIPFKVTLKGNYSGSFDMTFNIARIKIAKPAADGTSFVYTGSALTYNVATNSNYTISGNSETKAGSYTVKVVLKDKVNYEWADGTQTDLNFDFVIARVKVEKPTADTTKFIHTGKPLTYNVKSSNLYTVSGNEQTEIGEYEVKVSLKDKTNYEWTDGTQTDLTFDFTIKFNWGLVAIIGGSVVGAGAIAFVVIFCVRRNKGKKSKKEDSTK